MVVFEWMPGSWIFERTIVPGAFAQGTAQIIRISEVEANYAEEAQVTLATGEVLAGKQSYLYRRSDAGIDIHFADTGLLFQSLAFRQSGEWIATAIHRCGDDCYASEYVLTPPGRMFVRHVVRGPVKDYVSETTFRRVC